MKSVNVPLAIISLLLCKTVLSEIRPRSSCSNQKDDKDNFNKFMEELDDFTFNTYMVELKNCTTGKTYTYELNEDVIWNKRFELYDKFKMELHKCYQNCDTFKQCMILVRNRMTGQVKVMRDEVEDLLAQEKKKNENECALTSQYR